jgi:hypothetical protein
MKKNRKIKFEQMPEQLGKEATDALKGGMAPVTIYRIRCYVPGEGVFLDEAHVDDSPSGPIWV